MSGREHWDRVYSARAADALSWYQGHAERSLALIEGTGCGRDAAIIDIGGGTSTLTGDLLARGHSDLWVLDLSAAALAAARERLGPAAARVHWMEADVTRTGLPAGRFDIWHDRAVFHFLTEQDDRAAYVAQARAALKPAGRLIIATFAEDGPERCSGLPVVRYDAAALQAQFGDAFELLHVGREEHRTPAGKVQPFTWCQFRFLHP